MDAQDWQSLEDFLGANESHKVCLDCIEGEFMATVYFDGYWRCIGGDLLNITLNEAVDLIATEWEDVREEVPGFTFPDGETVREKMARVDTRIANEINARHHQEATE